MTDDTNALGERLRALRQQTGLSLAAVAASLVPPAHPNTVGNLERSEWGARASPRILAQLAARYGADPDELAVLAGIAPPDLVERLSTSLEDVKTTRTALHAPPPPAPVLPPIAPKERRSRRRSSFRRPILNAL